LKRLALLLLLLALAAGPVMAEGARSGYEASLRVIEVDDTSARRSCRTVPSTARVACLEKATAARSAARAQAGARLKSADVNRASGREIMAAHHESVADADRAGRAAASRRCAAMADEARSPCDATTKAMYRR
jgi:hypothetical protein